MIKKLCLVGGLGLVAAAVFPACSSSSSNNGSSGSFSSGLPKDASLGGLSAADQKTLCDSLQSYTSSLPANNSACKLAGIAQAAVSQFGGAKSDADLQKACSDAETACKNRPTPKFDAGTTTSTCKPLPANCTATVGELETCITDGTAASSKAFASIPECSALTASFFKPSDGGGLGGLGTTPPSCQPVNQKCPGLVGMSSATPPTP
jgi:hypothetical protein